MQFWPPDDEHMCSKHVEAWNKTYCEKNLCIKLVKYWDKYTALFEMIVGVLTTCHTKYTWDKSMYLFVFNRTILQVFVTYLIAALYVHPLWFYKHQHDNRVRSKLFVACQRWWFQWLFLFLTSFPGYLREEEEHKPLDPSVQLLTPISNVLCMTSR